MQQEAGQPRPSSPGLAPAPAAPAALVLHLVSAQGPSPWERLPSPLSGTIKTMAFYTARATSSISPGLTSIPA